MENHVNALDVNTLLNNVVINKIISRKFRKYRCLFDDYDDAKSEAVICLYKTIENYKNDRKCNFNTWFTRMLEYHYIDIYRKRKKDTDFWAERKRFDEKRLQSPYKDYGYGFLDGLFFLNAQQKTLLYQYYYQRMTFEEIASLLGVSKQRAEQKLKKVLSDIRNQVKDYNG